MAGQADAASITHLLAFGSFRVWADLLRKHRGVDREFLSRAAFVTGVSAATTPLRWYERARYNRAIGRTELPDDPIFVLGHWRSGTTNLHYLLSQDPRWGYVTLFQMMAPELLFVGDRVLKPLMRRMMPSKRPIDDLPMLIDGAQEEEFGMSSASRHSFYNFWFFPHQFDHYLRRYVLFDDTPEHVVAAWQHDYLWMLRKATMHMGGRRLLIKNPTNTARIEQLLKLFPNAKFVHIIRDPYRVLLSMRHMARTTITTLQFQRISDQQRDELVLRLYEATMQRYLRDRALIPAGNLVEVRFEDLEVDPMREARRIYRQLDLGGYEAAEPGMQAYIDSLKGYRKNSFALSDDDIATVNRRWGFAVDAWSYPRRNVAHAATHGATERELLPIDSTTTG